MRLVVSIGVVLFALATFGSGSAHAGEGVSRCDTATAAHARRLAEEARRNGDHRRAAECYRLAGDPLEADRALAKAFVEANAASTKKASATLEDAKLQARRVREALHGRPAPPRS